MASKPAKKKRSPYDTLGVKRGDSADTVKKAYRRRARETHPDAGGNPAEFKEVERAYRLLSDASRRARYDETGDDSEPRPAAGPDGTGGAEAAAIDVLAQVFTGIVNKILNSPEDPATVNIVEVMRASLTNSRGNILQNRAKVQSARAKMEKVPDRVQTDADAGAESGGSGNLLRSMAETMLRNLDSQLAAMDAELARLDLALSILAKYRYRVDELPKVFGMLGSGPSFVKLSFS